jgi:hypothetical protein
MVAVVSYLIDQDIGGIEIAVTKLEGRGDTIHLIEDIRAIVGKSWRIDFEVD